MTKDSKKATGEIRFWDESKGSLRAMHRTFNAMEFPDLCTYIDSLFSCESIKPVGIATVHVIKPEYKIMCSVNTIHNRAKVGTLFDGLLGGWG